METEVTFFDNYDILINFKFNSDSDKVFVGKKNNPCRFCGKTSGITFRKTAHAIPELVGNKKLMSYDECDACNDFFGENIEDHLGKYLGALRAIANIKGKKGIPAYKSKCDSRIEATEHGWNMEEGENDDETFEFDKENKKLHIATYSQPHIPIAVYKCFVKMAISVMPDDQLPYFEETIKWIMEKKHTEQSSPQIVLSTEVPGPPWKSIQLRLYKRKNDQLEVPYIIMVLSFGNHIFQVHVPSIVKDKIILEKNITISFFSDTFELNQDYGKLAKRKIDLSSCEIVKDLPRTITIRYDSMYES